MKFVSDEQNCNILDIWRAIRLLSKRFELPCVRRETIFK